MSSKDKWVRRFSVDETAKHKNGFTIYKITSVLFPIESPEAVTAVSVWKRYSDIQRLHKCMRPLHAGLHLRGTFPVLPQYSYFKRFQKEVIEERAKTIKTLLEFIAEHRLLFTSTDFVNFLQTGYPEPEPQPGGVINAIRSSLHLPIEETPPLEYNTEDDDSISAAYSARSDHQELTQPIASDQTDFISQIPIYEAADVEIRQSPKASKSDSFESINSLGSIDSELYEELNKLAIDKSKPSVKSKSVLPDLINFDGPSTSKFDDYHTMARSGSDSVSLSSNMCSSQDIDSRRSSSRVSVYSKSVVSLSNVECKTKTEDSYVFEAGYMLNLAARCEYMGDYSRAFECYKSGIEKMLIGVQTDTDPQRRALIKEKTNKYLSYAEDIYKNHLCDVEQSLLPERDSARSLHCPIPISMLKRPYEDLSLYRVLAVLGSSIMLVLHKNDQTCYAMKVTQKVPNNLTEFDEYFLQRTNETRQPILPTVIPYMVPLHAYIETNNLFFLILSYAPGEKLFDYIKNYAKSIPTTPAREVNLENVFSEPPKHRHSDIQNDNIDDNNIRFIDDISAYNSEANIKVTNEVINETNYNTKVSSDSARNNNDSKADSEVQELVLNSQKLLINVDKALSESNLGIGQAGSKLNKDSEVISCKSSVNDESIKLDVGSGKGGGKIDTAYYRSTAQSRQLLPPSAVCKWGAEILTSLESLHNAGVICRDLNPSNILLGDRGQIILTYIMSYPGVEMTVAKLRGDNMYIAPELHNAIMDDLSDVGHVCDYWSFGAIMYELLCGVPLAHYHRSVFTSHSILQLPDGLPVEVQSLLTQLLTYEPSERLGAGKDGVEEIKRHPYFKHIDWQYIYDSWIVPD